MSLLDYQKEEREKARAYGDTVAETYRTMGQNEQASVDRTYNTAIGNATSSYEKAKKDTAHAYRSVYDMNAVDELVTRRYFDETLANMGLTNSGMQVAQQAATTRRRKKNDERTTAHKQETLGTLKADYETVRQNYETERAAKKQEIQDAVTAEIERMYAELEKEADARAQTRYEQDVLSRQQETAQQETAQQKNTGFTHRTQRSGELRVTFTDATGTYSGYAAGEKKTLAWAQKLWDSGAFGTVGTSEAKEGLAAYLYAQHSGNNLENSAVVNSIYQTVTGEQNQEVLADGFMALLMPKEEYEKTHGDGSYSQYVQTSLFTAIASGFIRTYEELDKVISGYGVKEISVKKEDINVTSDVFDEIYHILQERIGVYNESVARLQEQYPNQVGQDVALLPSQLEFYRSRAGDGRYEVEIEDVQLENKVNQERNPVYGPQEIEFKYDIAGTKTDNLKPTEKADDFALHEVSDFSDFSREIELTELYRTARDGQNTLFLSVDGGIDFSAVPDYQNSFTIFLEMQTTNTDAFIAKYEAVQPKAMTDNQKAVSLAGFLIYLHDDLQAQADEDGAYDPYRYLAFEDFCNRLSKGEIEGVNSKAVDFAIRELSNYKRGEKIGEEVKSWSLAAKLFFGFGAGVVQGVESIMNLPFALTNQLTPTSVTSVANAKVNDSLDGGAKLAYNASNAFGTMTPYMVAGAVGGPAVGYSVMFLQGLGSSMTGALREGKGYTDALLYGVTSATVELVLNAALGAAGGALGQSVLGKTTSNLLQKGLAKMQGNPLLKKMIQFGGERLASGLGEGLEETLQAYTDSMLREVYFDEHKELSVRNEEALYNGLVGMIIGVLIGNGKSSAVTSSQLLSGTMSENIQVAQALCEATQGLSLTNAQQQLVKNTLTDIDRIQNGDADVEAAWMLEMQVDQMLNFWHQANLQAKANTNTETATPPAATEISLKSIKSAPTVGDGSPVPSQTDTKITAKPETALPTTLAVGGGDLDAPSTQAPTFTAPTVEELTEIFTASAEGRKHTPKTEQATSVDPETAEQIEAFNAGVEGRAYVPKNAVDSTVDAEAAETTPTTVVPEQPSSIPFGVDEEGEMESTDVIREDDHADGTMYRRHNNAGPFSHLTERMSKKHIKRLAKQYGIDLKGVSIHIEKNEELLRFRYFGRADSEYVGGITLFPNAFESKEELLRTVYHEKVHVEQYRKYGTEYVQNNRKYFEDLAYRAEEEFIDKLKERGLL